MSLLRTLLSESPQLAPPLFDAICDLPGLSIDDALLTIGRVARLRVGKHGERLMGPIASAADLLPVWFVRRIRHLYEPL